MATHPERTAWDRAVALGPKAVDLLVLAGVALCVAADVFALIGDDTTGYRLLASVGSLMAVAMRRRLPLVSYTAVITILVGLVVLRQATAAGYAYDYPLLAPVAALGAMVTTLVRRQPLAIAVSAVAAGALAMIILLSWPLVGTDRVLLTIGLGGIYAIGVGAGTYLRDLGRRSTVALEHTRRQERTELARELHDLVAHHVTGMVVQAQAALVVADCDPAAAGAALQRIEGAGREALDAMRRLVGSLRDEGGAAPTAPPAGLAGLSDLAAAAEATGLDVTVRVSADADERVTGAVAASVHRIVQESLTNVRRHADGAARVSVDVAMPDGWLLVAVEDDGFPSPERSGGRGYGLVGMTERAHELGGTLTAGRREPPPTDGGSKPVCRCRRTPRDPRRARR